MDNHCRSPNDPRVPTGTPAAADRSGGIRLGVLAWIFLRIGATAFGGFGATLTLLEREFVIGRRRLASDDLAEALAATRLLPGSTVVQLIAYVGYRLRGWPGSLVATVAYLAPSVLVMFGLAVGYEAAAARPVSAPALGGLTAAVVGLVAATGVRIARTSVQRPRAGALAIAAFTAGAGWGASAAAIVAVAGLLGIGLLRAGGRAPQEGGGR
jgi:chromate transporter